jgi:uncharacterized protein (DUF1800 family)
VPPRDPQAIDALAAAFVEHHYVIRDVLRFLFNADFFKRAMYARVKSPAEFVVGTARLTGGHRFPQVADIDLGLQTGFMGQQLLDPPSVEGWHTGVEWINTASLMTRVNFAARQFADATQPGVQAIIARVVAQGADTSPASLVDACLDGMGMLSVSESTREELIAHAAESLERGNTAESVQEVLQLIVATREYQLA